MGETTTTVFYNIQTFGCQLNMHDSERIAGQLNSLGYIETEIVENSDVIILNTCCVRESAEARIYGKIGALKKIKRERPEVILIVAGCMAQKEQEKIFRRAPHVDLALGPQFIDELPTILASISQYSKQSFTGDSNSFLPDGIPLTVRLKPPSAWVPITYGCDNFCSYCIVPYVRGRERSRQPQAILNEITQLAADGYREVTLLGQNVNSYGKGLLPAVSFAQLLLAADQISGIDRLRFMTSHPRDLTDDVISAIANANHLCEHVHLPLQSGSDEILHLMNRGYTTEYYSKVVKKLRSSIPGVAITTDIIVGYPGETDSHFESTLHFVEETRFDAAFTFLYSKRSGTPAASQDNQIPLQTKKQRLQQLMNRQNQISLDINEKLVGQRVEVLIDGPSRSNGNVFAGRTRTNKLVLWPGEPNDRKGDFRTVAIEKAQTFLLKGQ